MNTNIEAAFSAAVHVQRPGPFYGEFQMLWTKGWLETRWLVLLSLVFFALNLVDELVRMASPSANQMPALSDFLLLWIFVPALLAGNGIRTPKRFRASADGHLSMYYTLSLPVSRSRLLAVRALIGMVETSAMVLFAMGGIWIFLPSLRVSAMPPDAILYVTALLAYSSAFFSLSLLLAALIDGPWRVWGTVLLILGLRWALVHLPHHSFDVLAPIVSEMASIAHAYPWKGICVCMGLTTLFFATACRSVEAREY